MILTITTLSFLLFGNCLSQATDLTKTARSKGKDVVEAVVFLIRKSNIFLDDRDFIRRVAYVESKFGEDANTYRSNYYGGIWQLDETGFNATKNVAAYPTLSANYTRINQEFKINWTTVQWSDLEKPLYSGLAARLFLTTIPTAVPGTVLEQANYWKQYYNKNSSVTADKFRSEISALESTNECSGLVDLVIVLDGSGSIGNSDYQLAKQFVANLTETFSLDKVRIAFLVFSATTTVIFPLDNNLNHAQMKSAILSSAYPSSGTATNAAILEAILVFHNASKRSGVPQLMIVYTDGGSDSGVAGAMAEVAKTNITSFAVGIGSGINQTELVYIAGNANRVFTLSSFSALDDFVYRSNAETCDQRQKPTINESTADGLNQGEKRYFEYPVPAEGITIVLKNSSGQVIGYYSYTNEKPSSALNDGVINGVTFIPRSTENGTVIFVSIEGKQVENNYTIETTTGNKAQTTGLLSTCDNSLTLSPCECDGISSIKCVSATNYELKHVFDTVNTQLSESAFALFNSLTITNYNNAVLPVDVFGQMLFKTITISDSKITSVNKGTFVDTVLTIENFTLTRTQLVNNGSDIYEAVAKMAHLKSLNLSNNRLVSVPNNAFNAILAQQKNLKSISLANNKIASVGERAFYDLPAITHIDLSNNTIKEIVAQTFETQNESNTILELDLSHNSLEAGHFDPSWYEKMRRPVILNLSNNKLHSIPTQVFNVFLNRLHENRLVVTNNRLDCNCDAKWLLENKEFYKDRIIGAVCDDDNRPLFEWTLEELGHC